MAKSFDKVVEEEFGYLVSEFQFSQKKVKKIDGGYDILYVNDKCGVRIAYEFREAYIFITLYELKNGEFVDNPRPITKNSIINGFALDDVLLLRAPDAIIKPAYSYGIDSEFYDREKGLSLYVSRFAKNLKQYAADILVGDFSIFEKLDLIVKKRISER